jgi:hypothetical protein
MNLRCNQVLWFALQHSVCNDPWPFQKCKVWGGGLRGRGWLSPIGTLKPLQTSKCSQKLAFGRKNEQIKFCPKNVLYFHNPYILWIPIAWIFVGNKVKTTTVSTCVLFWIIYWILKMSCLFGICFFTLFDFNFQATIAKVIKLQLRCRAEYDHRNI